MYCHEVAGKPDREAHNVLYKGKVSDLLQAKSKERYVALYERTRISPFYAGGETKGYVRGEATRRAVAAAERKGANAGDVTILDAGCGKGELSVYLACIGFNVIGVDVSDEACNCARALADGIAVSGNCRFLSESLESMPIENGSVDVIVGHASLHHFIKYNGVPKEFRRVLCDTGEGFFADSYGENVFYHLFHDKEKMRRLGDVVLRKNLIEEYFDGFDVSITPADWFCMLDKLYMKLFPANAKPWVRRASRLHDYLDRSMPAHSRLALYLAGSVVTHIKKRH